MEGVSLREEYKGFGEVLIATAAEIQARHHSVAIIVHVVVFIPI